MCGLIGARGAVRHWHKPISSAIEGLSHRGPDAQGHFFVHDTLLGHVRLSIVDVANDLANQPITDSETGNVLIFNGEIYNYQDLRSRYLGHRTFRSASDTEVLLYLLCDLGLEKTLSVISGMFAFALFRSEDRRLILARDPIGKKPLFYTEDANGTFLFGSEVKALRLLGKSLEPSKSAVLNFMFERTFGYRNASFFDGVKQVEAGTYLSVDHELRTETVRYWNPGHISRSALDYNTAVRDFFTHLTRATLSRIPDEVPFAILLSGGLDSSAIAALAARNSGRDRIATVSAVYPSDPADESRYADQVLAMHPQLDPVKVEISTDHFNEAWQATTWAMEAPAPDGSMISHHLLMRKIREMGLKVVLSGNGGDEILAGYANTFVPAGNVNALRNLDFAGLSGDALTATAFHCLPDSLKNAVFRRRHRAKNFLRDPADLDLLETRYVAAGGHDIVARYAMHTLTHWTTPGFVWYEDRNAMASSIEARSPFYDRALVEFALSLPGSYLVRRGLTKRILRDAIRDIVPGGIVDRRDKQGFHAPIKTWMNAHYRDPLSDREFVDAFAWLDMPRIMQSGFLHVWRLLALHVWFRCFWPEHGSDPTFRY
ncbi:asparagine synthase (glutamine-hydrolyzing) [Marinovum algicola DG 898]|nr:asparagine synthase (glutamine-hydrolyzing) [Marinovum algicola DG 898]